MKDFNTHKELTNKLTSKYPNLNIEVVFGWDNNPQIKTESSGKAKVLREMFFGQGYMFSF